MNQGLTSMVAFAQIGLMTGFSCSAQSMTGGCRLVPSGTGFPDRLFFSLLLGISVNEGLTSVVTLAQSRVDERIFCSAR